MKNDDYMAGRHFWAHFGWGIVVGGAVGARLFWSMFDSQQAYIGCVIGFAVAFALAVGYWGDAVWLRLLDLLAFWLRF